MKQYTSQPASVGVQHKTAQASAPCVPPGFAICPMQAATTNAWQQEIYRLAYEQAQAAVSIPRHHRLLFSVWN